MIIGISIVAIATITISLWPGQSVQTRSQKEFEESQPTPKKPVKRVTLPKPPSDKPQTPPPEQPITVIDTTPKPPDPIYHVVKSGETLYSIADHYYSDPTKWNKIKTANKTIPEKNTLRPGMRLIIPMD